MPSPFTTPLLRSFESSALVAVVVIETEHEILHVADALLAGGITCVELALRTPGSLDALRALKSSHPRMTVGAGTVIGVEQVSHVRDAGADFAVAPGCNPRVIAAAKALGLPFAPGVATPSDIEAAVEQGCNVLKFFPAEPSGGLPYLKNIGAPFAHLGLRFIPLGGISEDTLRPYLAEPSVLAVGGSWIAPRELIQARDWAEIARRAIRARGIINDSQRAS